MDEPRNQLFRDLAHSLNDVEDFTLAFPTDEAAAKHFFDVAHNNRCPLCASEETRLVGPRHIACDSCRRVRSLTASTPLRNTKLSLRLCLAAVWHVLVDTDNCTARGFGRRYDLRPMTAWYLFHKVRAAAPYPAPGEGGVTGQVLGRHSPRNTAFVTIATEGDHLTATLAGECEEGKRPAQPHISLWLGRLRAWIGGIFRGVKREYLPSYLGEFIHRYGRKNARFAYRHDPPLLPRWTGPDPA